jgi:hypothetical protein
MTPIQFSREYLVTTKITPTLINSHVGNIVPKIILDYVIHIKCQMFHMMPDIITFCKNRNFRQLEIVGL